MTEIYAVYVAPRYQSEDRLVEGLWQDSATAQAHAERRSVQVCGELLVLAWILDKPGRRRLVAAYRDGQWASSSATRTGDVRS